MIQPPRGFGENPIAIYHDPDMPPSHHYMAAYRWLEATRGGSAPTRSCTWASTARWSGCRARDWAVAGCAPDAVLGDLPLVYPFIVNDPGEGTQAKRRGHATVVDHLVPPMARADTYGDLAKLEQLLDEYALVLALDPTKAPAVRAQIWTLVKAGRAAPRPACRRAAGRRRLRRVRHAHRRLSVRDQGRADPRRAAHPGRRAGRRGAGEPGAGRAARLAGVGRHGERAARAAGLASPSFGLVEKELLAEPGRR